jgi:hypothetical protein
MQIFAHNRVTRKNITISTKYLTYVLIMHFFNIHGAEITARTMCPPNAHNACSMPPLRPAKYALHRPYSIALWRQINYAAGGKLIAGQLLMCLQYAEVSCRHET